MLLTNVDWRAHNLHILCIRFCLTMYTIVRYMLLILSSVQIGVAEEVHLSGAP